jgi:hypothetical protein
MGCVTTETEATGFARQWVAAWNSHDLDAIMSHYDEAVVLTSPAAAKILDDPSGTIEGNAAVRRYFERGLELYPDLHFQLLDVMWGLATRASTSNSFEEIKKRTNDIWSSGSLPISLMTTTRGRPVKSSTCDGGSGPCACAALAETSAHIAANQRRFVIRS